MTGLAAFVFHISERMAMVSESEGVADASMAGDDDELDMINNNIMNIFSFIIVISIHIVRIQICSIHKS